MAGVSTKEIKSRIRSMESTKQITKAMEMVAASKLRHAQAQITSSRPYFHMIYGVIQDIASINKELTLPYLSTEKQPAHRVAYIVIAGDRGLAGGYNANVFRLAAQTAAEQVIPIGRRACDRSSRRGRACCGRSLRWRGRRTYRRGGECCRVAGALFRLP